MADILKFPEPEKFGQMNADLRKEFQELTKDLNGELLLKEIDNIIIVDENNRVIADLYHGKTSIIPGGCLQISIGKFRLLMQANKPTLLAVVDGPQPTEE